LLSEFENSLIDVIKEHPLRGGTLPILAQEKVKKLVDEFAKRWK